MYTVRCSICRQQMPTLKLLISHYLTSHSKLKIIKQVLKYSILQSTPSLFKHKYKSKMRKTETLYLNENIHILCSQNEIIIGDNKSNVDMEFSFDENSNEILVIPHLRLQKTAWKTYRHYHINITKLKNQQTLDEKSGEFYMCHCRENVVISPMETKIFCQKCGSGYNTENDLMNHMQVHETFCRLCNEYFPNEYVFKEHMRLHIFKVYMCHVCGREFPFRELLQVHFECHVEDRTFETVLDMEEDYRIHRYSFMNMNYNSSINSILCYLSESHDIYYYSYKFMKVICEFCFNEVFLFDYEQHLQNVHYTFSF
ncbi:zinc finger protein 560-like [Anoplophora glabripennis]|uniref:zinc finger protein 560-like n=1 Tax=Anoplophora glabripennis TaxID=217634 RepID=UPI000C787FA4|nr:zinc finger protein 560-like [Anoplophora glabripennis]